MDFELSRNVIITIAIPISVHAHYKNCVETVLVYFALFVYNISHAPIVL